MPLAHSNPCFTFKLTSYLSSDNPPLLCFQLGKKCLPVTSCCPSTHQPTTARPRSQAFGSSRFQRPVFSVFSNHTILFVHVCMLVMIWTHPTSHLFEIAKQRLFFSSTMQFLCDFQIQFKKQVPNAASLILPCRGQVVMYLVFQCGPITGGTFSQPISRKLDPPPPPCRALQSGAISRRQFKERNMCQTDFCRART